MVAFWTSWAGEASRSPAWEGRTTWCLSKVGGGWSMPGQRCQDLFYTDADVVADFRAYVATILNHRNPHTGLAYKEDPTIMAWESGNELHFPPFQWTLDLAAYIKQELGAVQLFMDGRQISATGVRALPPGPRWAGMRSWRSPGACSSTGPLWTSSPTTPTPWTEGSLRSLPPGGLEG